MRNQLQFVGVQALACLLILCSCSLEDSNSALTHNLSAQIAADAATQIAVQAADATKITCSPLSTSASPLALAAVGYTDTVAQIVTTSCLGCHSTGAQAPDLSTYALVVKVAAVAAADVASGRMPMGLPLASADAASFAAWVAAGTPLTAAAAAASATTGTTAPSTAPATPAAAPAPASVAPAATACTAIATTIQLPAGPAVAATAPSPSAAPVATDPSAQAPATPAPAPAVTPVSGTTSTVSISGTATLSITGKPTSVAASGTFTEIDSPSGVYAFRVQADGNMVEYRSGSPVWSSNTDGSGTAPYVGNLDATGNLLIDQGNGTSTYSTGTSNKGVAPYTLSLNNNGTVAIIDSANKTVFSTGNFGGLPATANDSSSSGGITYTNTIQSFVTGNCGYCHQGDSQPPNLTNYYDVITAASLALPDIVSKKMPAIGTLTPQEITNFQTWVNGGMPQ